MKKKIGIVIIIILVIFACWLTYLKFFSNNVNSEIENNYIENGVKEYKYSFTIGDTEKTYKLYIDNENLYISNLLDNSVKELSSVNFKYIKSVMIDSYIYLISNDNKLYRMFGYFNNIDDITVDLVNTKYDVINFTNLKLIYGTGVALNNLIVLSSDNILYDAYSGLKYDDVKVVFDNIYYILKDHRIADNNGDIINYDGVDLKIKYYLRLEQNHENFGRGIIITTDNKFIIEKGYSYIVDGIVVLKSAMVYNKDIKDYSFENLDDDLIKLTITFDDGDNVQLTGYVTKYYGFN